MSTKTSSHPKWNTPINFHDINGLQEYIFPNEQVVIILVKQIGEIEFEYLHSEFIQGSAEKLKKVANRFSFATDYEVLAQSPEDSIGLNLLKEFQGTLETEPKPLIFTVPKLV